MLWSCKWEEGRVNDKLEQIQKHIQKSVFIVWSFCGGYLKWGLSWSCPLPEWCSSANLKKTQWEATPLEPSTCSKGETSAWALRAAYRNMPQSSKERCEWSGQALAGKRSCFTAGRLWVWVCLGPFRARFACFLLWFDCVGWRLHVVPLTHSKAYVNLKFAELPLTQWLLKWLLALAMMLIRAK